MAAQIENQTSITDLDNGEIFDPISSDADSSTDSTILLGEGSPEHGVITTCLLSGMGSLAIDTEIAAVRKNSSQGITTKAKHIAFRIFTEAIARKNGGDPNVKYGWFGGSKDEIQNIFSYGFSSRDVSRSDNDGEDGGSHGVGIHLVPPKFSQLAAMATEQDDDGLRHLLLCRLILGKPERIIPGSKQTCPSSNEFDSGVDDIENPRKYIVWSSTMNSYILPSYIVSFRSPRIRVISRGGLVARPSSPRVCFAALMSMLAKSMEPSRMRLIIRSYDDFRKRKIQREHLVRKMREVAGDNLLAEIIKNHIHKNKVKM
ncbi:unnamed protein product [Cochlearia groenlandica]